MTTPLISAANRVNIAVESKFNLSHLLYTSCILPFNMQLQTQSNWCWAATATSVSEFYSIFCNWTQCKVASQEMASDCCATPGSTTCNQPWYLDKALSRTNNHVSISGGTLSWEDVKDELEKGLVVGARIGWSGGGGHFMVIHGVSKVGNTKYLHIDDPIYQKSVLPYNTFATAYQGSGTWTHYYITKKHYCMAWLKDLLYERELLKPIPQVRPLLFPPQEIERDASMYEPRYSLPHFTYHLGLDKLEEAEDSLKNPASLRVVEVDGESAKAIYELNLNPEKAEVVNLSSDAEYLGTIEDGLDSLKRKDEDYDETGELRVIRVPALNIEALWLHYEEGASDLITVIRGVNSSQIDRGVIYSKDDFVSRLAKLAADFKEFDDTMGA